MHTLCLIEWLLVDETEGEGKREGGKEREGGGGDFCASGREGKGWRAGLGRTKKKEVWKRNGEKKHPFIHATTIYWVLGMCGVPSRSSGGRKWKPMKILHCQVRVLSFPWSSTTGLLPPLRWCIFLLSLPFEIGGKHKGNRFPALGLFILAPPFFPAASIQHLVGCRAHM